MFNVDRTYIEILCLLFIAIICCSFSLYTTNKIDKCVPVCNNEHLLKTVLNIVNNKHIVNHELNTVKKHDWTKWVEYDKLTESPVFTKMSHGEILNIMNKSKCKLNEGTPSWKIYGLILNGKVINNAKTVCPRTTSMLTKIPGIINAGFSCFEPGASTTVHRGYNDNILRCHIPIEIPSGDTCIRIENRTTNFKGLERTKGYLIFNDTCVHQAWNNTKYNRIVLIIDFDKSQCTL